MNTRIAFASLLALQLLCTVFFLSDKVASLIGIQAPPIAWHLYELIEIGAALGLVTGVIVTAMLLARSLRKQAAAEKGLRVASGAFMEVLDEKFAEWGLTPAERDVALFSVKGLSTSEIAAMRRTSEGTVKAQTNAIYRKAGVSGRPQLLAVFIEDLMGEPLRPRH